MGIILDVSNFYYLIAQLYSQCDVEIGGRMLLQALA